MITGSSWHLPQVSTASRAANVLASGSRGDRMWCSPWQSVHVGLSVTPAWRARPWMDRSYASCMSGWHCPQVAATFRGLIRDAGSAAPSSSWTPWQSAQEAAAAIPRPVPRPWMDCA
jgi:hypothetical protein